MTIDELAKLKSKSIPNSELVKYYEAALPQYHMEAVLTLLKKKKLSVLQEFILKFVSVGYSSIYEIRNFLGVNIAAINNAVAILQKDGMLSIDIFKSTLRMTDKGEIALKEAAIIVPENIEYAIFIDGLLGNIYLDTKSLYSKKQVKNLDLTAVIPDIEFPTLENLKYEEVKQAINSFKKKYVFEKDKLEGDLQSIERVDKVYVEYKKVYVLVFMNSKTEDVEFQVYEGSTRNDNYSIILQKMYNNNVFLFNFDIKKLEDESNEYPILSLLPQEIIESAKEFSTKASSLDKDISSLTMLLTEMKELGEDEEEEQKESSTEKIRFLEQKLREIEDERKGADRVLSTYDHRPLLIDALENAHDSVIIISPWIKSSGLNNQIITLIEKAAQRKTKVIICYGISETEDSDTRVIRRLEEIKNKSYGSYLELVRLNNTHEKVLIKDNDFMIITSFNWLSFKGDPNRGFRQETGYYTESKDAIAQMKSNLSQDQRIGIRL